jgi:magnesium transporter
MSTTRFFHVTPKGKVVSAESLEALLAERKSAGYLWVDYIDPTREELLALAEALGLHPVAVENCLDEDQVPKINDFPNHSFVLFNRCRYAGGALAVDEVDAFLGGDFLVTVTRAGPEQGARLAQKLDEAVRAELESVKRGPDYLLHVILDHALDDTFVVIEALEEEIDAAQEVILAKAARFDPSELVRLRRHLLALRKSLLHEREVLVKICRRDSPYVGEKAIYHFRDIYDHLAKFFEVIEIEREMITSLMEMYLSLVNNAMARSANSTNRVVRRLTLITTIFMPLTLLAGIGGMSEWSMMTDPANWKIAYPAFLLAMAVLGVANYVLLRWVERRSKKAAELDEA